MPSSTLSLTNMVEGIAQQCDGWPDTFVAAVRDRLGSGTEAALLRRLGQALAPVALTTPNLPLPTAWPATLPWRTGDALLLPLPGCPNGLLWLCTPLPTRRVQVRLRGWLSVVGLGLERRWQQEELERQRSARDHFFSMVNHDLKSPLSSIKAMTDLIVRKVQRGTLDPSTEVGRADLLERLIFLSQRVRDMAGMIDEIADVSAIERGRLALHPQRTELRGVIEAATERLRAKYEREVEVEGGEEPLRLQADAARVTQIVYNLLKNALDYSEGDTPVKVRLTAQEGQATVQVKDQGSGIPAEKQERLFQEYGRTVQEGASGLGIGLYVAAALVEAHGGTIQLESEQGEGTTVCFTLPLEEANERP